MSAESAMGIPLFLPSAQVSGLLELHRTWWSGTGSNCRPSAFQFFAQSFQARSGEGVFEDWFRSGRYFSDGRLLIWEYPRETPKGDQTDVVESMDLENGLITHHRVYWGWVGFNKLHNAINKARQ